MLEGYRTYLAAIAALASAIAILINNYLNGGNIDLNPAVGAFTALALVFLRSAVKQGGKTT
jgi:Mg2+ and Co2+ transporter CorA